MSTRVPVFKTDEEAEAFLNQDLSDLDFAAYQRVRFEFEKKTAQINMRLPAALLDAVKQQSASRGIPYTRFIRELIEQAVTKTERAVGSNS